MLDCGAAADQPRDDGATALYQACSDSHAELVAILLAAGAQVEQVNPAGMTPLWAACSCQDEQASLDTNSNPNPHPNPNPNPNSNPNSNPDPNPDPDPNDEQPALVRMLLVAAANPLKRVLGWSALDLARVQRRDATQLLLTEYVPEGSLAEPEPRWLREAQALLGPPVSSLSRRGSRDSSGLITAARDSSSDSSRSSARESSRNSARHSAREGGCSRDATPGATHTPTPTLGETHAATRYSASARQLLLIPPTEQGGSAAADVAVITSGSDPAVSDGAGGSSAGEMAVPVDEGTAGMQALVSEQQGHWEQARDYTVASLAMDVLFYGSTAYGSTDYRLYVHACHTLGARRRHAPSHTCYTC